MTKKPLLLLALLLPASLLVLALPACDAGFTPDRSRPAVESPTSSNSASSEFLNPATPAAPLLSVDLPNTKTEKPTLHTLADPLLPPPPATQPTAPTVHETPPRPLDPITGQ